MLAERHAELLTSKFALGVRMTVPLLLQAPWVEIKLNYYTECVALVLATTTSQNAHSSLPSIAH